MAQKTSRRWLFTLLGWFVACSLFFPIFWMFLTSFKTEVRRLQLPLKLFFQPTLENYVAIPYRANYFNYALNSVAVSLDPTRAAACRTCRLCHVFLPNQTY